MYTIYLQHRIAASFPGRILLEFMVGLQTADSRNGKTGLRLDTGEGLYVRDTREI